MESEVKEREEEPQKTHTVVSVVNRLESRMERKRETEREREKT
jgi:hypothetical protein